MEGNSNDRKLKLIWDFRGPDAERTAEHHAIHLKEYLLNHKITPVITGCENPAANHFIAYLVVKKSLMPQVRDALKPHRGQVFSE